MFSCFFSMVRGQSPRKAPKDHPQCRCWFLSHGRQLWPFNRRDRKVTQGVLGQANPDQTSFVVPSGHPYIPSPCVCVEGRFHEGGPP